MNTIEPNSHTRSSVRAHSPHDSVYTELLARLRASPLADYAEAIGGLAIRAVNIETTTPQAGEPLGATRLGGLPDLPPGVPYPCIEGQPLTFLAQIDMAEGGRAHPALPQQGLLSLFLGQSESCDEVESRVLYTDMPAAELLRAGLPAGTPRCEDDYTAQPHGAVLRPTWTLPGYGDDTIEQVLPASLLDAWSDFTLAWGEAANTPHSVMGYAEFDLWPPQDSAAKAFPGTLAEDWLVLARLGMDRKTGFCFWDGGTLNFLVQKNALLRRDFGQVYTWLFSS